MDINVFNIEVLEEEGDENSKATFYMMGSIMESIKNSKIYGNLIDQFNYWNKYF